MDSQSGDGEGCRFIARSSRDAAGGRPPGRAGSCGKVEIGGRDDQMCSHEDLSQAG